MIINIINAILKEIKSGIVANGVSYPRASDKLLMNNPKSIRKEMLSPTVNTNFSVSPILFNFNICRINNPGTTVRKRNPKICLRNNISKSIAKSVKISSSARIKKKTLVSSFFDIYVIFQLDYQEPLRISLPFIGGCIY
jgi:hypothetical protein